MLRSVVVVWVILAMYYSDDILLIEVNLKTVVYQEKKKQKRENKDG